ncbi:MAG: hypothetical protein AAB420_01850 [Patescibacteria group bacterium]
MKKYLAGGLVGVGLALFMFLVFDESGGFTVDRNRSEAGNLSGSHYNLNIIGVPNGKSVSGTGSSGHRIFVPLVGSCRINLAQGDFKVLDFNCTDGSSQFQLPNPDPDNDGLTVYSVWARALGKPGGSSTTTTCAKDPVDGADYCSVYSMVQVRKKGQSSFSNVSKQLLYVYADIDADGVLDRMPLFDDRLQDYYWSYDNNGMRLMQLRFYPIGTNVEAGATIQPIR